MIRYPWITKKRAIPVHPEASRIIQIRIFLLSIGAGYLSPTYLFPEIADSGGGDCDNGSINGLSAQAPAFPPNFC